MTTYMAAHLRAEDFDDPSVISLAIVSAVEAGAIRQDLFDRAEGIGLLGTDFGAAVLSALRGSERIENGRRRQPAVAQALFETLTWILDSFPSMHARAVTRWKQFQQFPSTLLENEACVRAWRRFVAAMLSRGTSEELELGLEFVKDMVGQRDKGHQRMAGHAREVLILLAGQAPHTCLTILKVIIETFKPSRQPSEHYFGLLVLDAVLARVPISSRNLSQSLIMPSLIGVLERAEHAKFVAPALSAFLRCMMEVTRPFILDRPESLFNVLQRLITWHSQWGPRGLKPELDARRPPPADLRQGIHILFGLVYAAEPARTLKWTQDSSVKIPGFAKAVRPIIMSFRLHPSLLNEPDHKEEVESSDEEWNDERSLRSPQDLGTYACQLGIIVASDAARCRVGMRSPASSPAASEVAQESLGGTEASLLDQAVTRERFEVRIEDYKSAKLKRTPMTLPRAEKPSLTETDAMVHASAAAPATSPSGSGAGSSSQGLSDPLGALTSSQGGVSEASASNSVLDSRASESSSSRVPDTRPSSDPVGLEDVMAQLAEMQRRIDDATSVLLAESVPNDLLSPTLPGDNARSDYVLELRHVYLIERVRRAQLLKYVKSLLDSQRELREEVVAADTRHKQAEKKDTEIRELRVARDKIRAAQGAALAQVAELSENLQASKAQLDSLAREKSRLAARETSSVQTVSRLRGAVAEMSAELLEYEGRIATLQEEAVDAADLEEAVRALYRSVGYWQIRWTKATQYGVKLRQYLEERGLDMLVGATRLRIHEIMGTLGRSKGLGDEASPDFISVFDALAKEAESLSERNDRLQVTLGRVQDNHAKSELTAKKRIRTMEAHIASAEDERARLVEENRGLSLALASARVELAKAGIPVAPLMEGSVPPPPPAPTTVQ